MTFSMPSLFCLKLSLSPPIISKKHHAASADNIGVLKAPHTAPPRPHHSAPPHSVGHGPQRVPIFFGILVGTHKKSRPRRRNRRRRTPRPNGKKNPSEENSEKLNRNFCKINWSYSCPQQFDKFWLWNSSIYRKSNTHFALKKIVNSHQTNVVCLVVNVRTLHQWRRCRHRHRQGWRPLSKRRKQKYLILFRKNSWNH